MLTLILRASVLFRLFAVFMVGSLIANPLGGFLLSQGPWVALFTGNFFMFMSITALCFLPETLIVRKWHDAKAGKISGLSSSLNLQVSEGEEDLKNSDFRAAVDAAKVQLLNGREFLVTNKRVVVLMIPLIFETVEKYIEELLMQYSTKRYGWSWSKVCSPFPAHISGYLEGDT